MPITKYDLNVIANQYFIYAMTSPKHPVTPEVCDAFAWKFYNYAVAIPSDENALRNLMLYINSQAEYYGVDPAKAAEFLKQVPGIRNLFIQYIKDNYGIQPMDLNDVLNEIAKVISGGIWAIIKPLIPLAILGFGIMYSINHSKSN